MSSTAKSLELKERTSRVTPGTQSNLAGLWPGAQPLFIEKGKVRFEINVKAAAEADLQISSKLLRLARIVGGKK